MLKIHPKTFAKNASIIVKLVLIRAALAHLVFQTNYFPIFIRQVAWLVVLPILVYL